MEIYEIKTCCRICLTTNFKGQSIFKEYRGEYVPNIVRDITGLKVLEDEEISDRLCFECIEKLMEAQLIRRTCLQSDAILRSQTAGTISKFVGDCQEEVEEKNIKCAGVECSSENECIAGNVESEFQIEVIQNEESSASEGTGHNEDAEEPPNRTRFQCLTCSKEFSRESAFKHHQKNHMQRTPQCPICQREFAHKSNLKRHIATHKNETHLRCEECNEIFDDPALFYEHLKAHNKNSNEEYVHECEVCRKQSTSLALHRAHLKNDHSLDAQKPFKCRICGMLFASKQGMFRHIDNIHEDNRRNLRSQEKNFLCNSCGKRFFTNFHLQVHIRTHTGERPFNCDRCSKSFSQLSGLKMHTYTHTGQRPFACQICGKTFNQYGHVREHSLTHSDQRPHICKICGHSFRVKGNLTAHLMIHTGTKPYICTVCGKSYAQNTKLKAHIAKNHGQNITIH